MARPFNISYSASKGWQCNPPSQVIPKSEGATFNVACSHGKTGAVLCFTGNSVFGTFVMHLSCGDRQHKDFTGNAGDSTDFHIQDAGTTCVHSKKKGKKPFDDPFEITIASDQEPKKKKK